MLAHYGVYRSAKACPAPGRRITTTPSGPTPRVAGVHHGRPCRAGHPDRPRVRPQNAIEESGGRSMIIGAGICHWFHGDATYRAMALLLLTGCDGPQRRRLGALRRPGEVPPDHRLGDHGDGPDWSARPQMAGTPTGTPTPIQWRYDGYRADAPGNPVGRGRFRRQTSWTCWRRRPRWAGRRSIRTFDRSSLDLADEARPGRRPRGYVAEQLASGRSSSPSPIRTRRRTIRGCSTCGANLLGSSSAKGNEYFLRHLLAPTNLHRRRSPEGLRPTTLRGPTIPEGKLDLLTTGRLPDDVSTCCCLGRRAARGHLVREGVTCRAPTCTPSTTRSARRSTRRRRPGRTDAFRTPSPSASAHSPRGTSAPAPMSSPVPCSTTPRRRWRPGWPRHDWRAEGDPGAGQDDGSAGRRAGLPAIADKMTLGPAMEKSRPDHQGHHHPSRRRGGGHPAASSACSIRCGAGPSGDHHRRADGRRDPALSGTNGHWPSRGSGTRAPHRGRWCTWPSTRASRSPSPTPRSAGPGDHQPGVVGQRDRRPAVCPVHHQHRGAQEPFHTLTGRMHFYLDHDWMRDG